MKFRLVEEKEFFGEDMLKKLYDKKFREEEGCFIIDGIKIFEEAIEESEELVFTQESFDELLISVFSSKF